MHKNELSNNPPRALALSQLIADAEQYLTELPYIQEGDLTTEMLAEEWGLKPGGTRYKMQQIAKRSNGKWQCMMVYDPSPRTRHDILVLRKVT